MEPVVFTLKNGIKVIHRYEDSPVAHLAMLIDAGSRDELPNEHGIAHLIEHMIFKGTKKRKAFHVLTRIDAVGGEINAYTSKEETCVYASFLHVYFERTFELFSDILMNSQFPEKEIGKEKQVIMDEISSYDDNPSEIIFDRFEEEMFPDHPLGKSILGTKESLKKLSREKIFSFIKRHYLPEHIVIATAGKAKLDEIKQLCETYFGSYKSSNKKIPREKAKKSKRFEIEIAKPVHQAHWVLGNRAFGQHDKKRFAMSLLNNLLGGPAMNSRLNLAVREKHGYAYNLESNYQMFTETGVFSVYLGTDIKYLEKAKELVFKELKKLSTEKLGTRQLSAAKQQLVGQITLSQESRMSLVLAMAKSVMTHGKMDPLEILYTRINELTATQIADIASEIFDENHLSQLTFKPENGILTGRN